MGNIVGPFNKTFATKNNNGRIMKLGLDYDYEVNETAKIALTCRLCSYFGIPCLNVMTSDGFYCK